MKRAGKVKLGPGVIERPGVKASVNYNWTVIIITYIHIDIHTDVQTDVYRYNMYVCKKEFRSSH